MREVTREHRARVRLRVPRLPSISREQQPEHSSYAGRIAESLRRHPEMTLFLTLALGYRSGKLRTGRVALAALAMALAAAGV